MEAFDPYEQLRIGVRRWVDVPDDLWPAFEALFQPRTVARGEHLVYGGDVLTEVFFVARGLVRLYYTDADGREWNKTLVAEGGFAGSIAAILLGGPAPYAIQALEDADVLAASWLEMDALYEQHPPLERLGRRFAEWLLVKKELRERAFLELDATARYQAFLRDEPELAARVPLYHVASYLGVTEVSLSRIRGRLARSDSG